jgi:DNA-directed RNA polymerase specialized sigma54-like protein
LGFEQFCRLEDRLNFGANRSRRFRAYSGLDFAEAVRHRIRQLIDDESVEDILSDDIPVEKLRAAGI